MSPGPGLAVRIWAEPGADFVGWTPADGDGDTLGVVDFSIFPHLDHELVADDTMAAAAQTRAADIGDPPTPSTSRRRSW